MFELKIITGFAAAHRLQMVSKKCENLHGHNWKVEVRVRGAKLNRTGVVVDFGVLKKHVRAVMKKLDHKFLNDVEGFGDHFPPSSENVAVYVAAELGDVLKSMPGDVKVSSVTAWESDNAAATYWPE